MRTAFIDTLFDLAKQDDRITLMVGDLGFGVVTRFMEELPRQFVNSGVAEQNMTGMAAGLALSGKTVFTYSIANFPVLRCLEQIRNDVCYHNANVKIVAVGGGMAYGALGISHHATEDIAVLRAIPNLTIFTPNDPVEARFATRAAADLHGPCYLRLGRAGEFNVHENNIPLELGKAVTVKQGSDVTLIVAGGLLSEAVKASELLEKEGLSVGILSIHTLKPIDEDAIRRVAVKSRSVFSLEEHSIVGGLGSTVAEIIAESGIPTKFKRIGLRNEFSSIVGDQKYLRSRYGLDAPGIVQTVVETLR